MHSHSSGLWLRDTFLDPLKALRRRKGGFHLLKSYRHVGNEELGKLMD